MTARLDHLVVAARTLQDGVAWAEGRLGATLSPGGEHEVFGTHNALLSLGEDAYLEVIAVNPAAPPPARPRWFGLGTPEMRDRLEGGPALIHWIARVENLQPAPDVLELSRGDYRWRLTVPADGSLPMYGVSPSLISWLTPTPAARLPGAGVRLVTLQLGTAYPDRLRARLDALNFEGDVEVYEAPQAELQAVLETPRGLITL